MEGGALDGADSSCAPTPASWTEPFEIAESRTSGHVENASDSPDRTPWLATPLDPTRSYIRVLKLHRGVNNEGLACDLDIVDLDARPHFEVLSYVWGDASITEEVNVAGVSFQATTNLADFLRCLRLPDQERVVWADAICIDQSNPAEKSHQIGLMTEIYRHATEAHVWFGPFTDAWFLDLAGNKDYQMAVELDDHGWAEYERHTNVALKYLVKQEGFRPIDEVELADFTARCENNIFQTTMETLDLMATDVHLYRYPCYSYREGDNGERQYRINKSWLMMMDCIRWLLQRPWWSRVWTLQEAVLPKVDPFVHAPPFSFRLSRILRGVWSMIYHNNAICCKWYGGPATTSNRHSDTCQPFHQAMTVYNQRDVLADGEEGTGVPLELVVSAIQTRKATEVRDYWYGLFGFLPTLWQEMDKSIADPTATAGLFCQFSKLLYFQSQDLTRLDLACRGLRSQIPSLPSWAIDLTSQRENKDTDFDRWELYNASNGQKFDCELTWPELGTSAFIVKGVRVASVQNVAERILPSNYGPPDLLRLVQEWRALHSEVVRPPDDDAFWRAVFMDANVQRHWMSKRDRPLASPRLEDIKQCQVEQ
ncbi:heterokaryon incompatibility protein-domain-containing protein [Paraphoma chrysanthemicola]|uniref:Heterokaryon incompatibility protein-domain-containing protein n=1 Tax=Paraphoma chrysanthemicola TaxID=798071 RepID=A0A8K0W357_9PLEO|nr:heterokaryon incompatibility protein-domain-containing protein [Paraphoma chrysanthemicola]